MNPLLLQAAGGDMGSLMQFIPLVGILVVFYFFMIRPQQKRQKEETAFRSALKKGDKVKTIGGMHGTIETIEDTTVVLRFDDTLKIRFDKSAIVQA